MLLHMAYGIIYEIQCSHSGKSYVGQTTRGLKSRWAKHVEFARRGGKTHLAAAIRAYGPDAFTIQVLEECPDRQQLNDRESFWINQKDSLNQGYNLTTGGDAREWSLESRQRFSANHPLRGKTGSEHPAFGYHHTPEAVERIRESSQGRQHSEETKRVLSEKNMGEANPHYGVSPSPETKLKRAATQERHGHPMKGKSWSPEVLERMKEGHRKNPTILTQEQKDAIAAKLRGRPKSEEHRQKLSEAAKRRRAHVRDQTSDRNEDEVP